MSAVSDGMRSTPFFNMQPRRRRSRSAVASWRDAARVRNVDAITRLTDAVLVLSEQLDHCTLGSKLLLKSPTRSLQLYEVALNRRERPDCLHALASLLENGAPGVAPDRPRAVGLYSRAVKRSNNPTSLYSLARNLETGAIDVPSDTFRARALYANLVATTPHLLALRRLADMLLNGTPDVSPEPRRAVYYLQRAVDEFSDAQSMLRLASILIEGHPGILSDPTRALHLYKRAVNVGSLLGILKMAHILLRGTYGVRADPLYAIRLFNRASIEFSDTGAMVTLAHVLRRGTHGIAPHPRRAVQFYELAIKTGGSVDAMFALSFLLIADTDGIRADTDRAVKLFLQAVKNGGEWDEWWTTEFSTRSAMDSDDQEHRAEKLLKLATDHCEDIQVMLRLADMLFMGSGLVSPQPEKAATLYFNVYERSRHPRATRAMADILLTGLFGMKKNPTDAIDLYTNLVDHNGDVAAMLDLAHVLDVGLHGVPADVPRAVDLLVEAAHASPTNITILRLAAAALIQGPSRDHERALDLYEVATMRPDPHLGALTDYADFLVHDHRRAAMLYRRAAERGSPYAMYRLASILRTGADGVGPNKREALRLCERAAPFSSHALCLLYVMLGQLAQETGSPRDQKRARRVLRRAIEREGQRFVMSCLRDIPGIGELDLSFGPLRTSPTMPRVVRPLYNTSAFRY